MKIALPTPPKPIASRKPPIANGAPPHDTRIDTLGFCAELQKRLADPLKSAVKIDMLDRAIDRLAGESFDSLLVQGTTRTVDPAKFLRLYERGKITRDQFCGAIRVKSDAALDGVSRDDLAAISTEAPSSPALRVTLRKGEILSLADVMDGIRAAAAC